MSLDWEKAVILLIHYDDEIGSDSGASVFSVADISSLRDFIFSSFFVSLFFGACFNKAFPPLFWPLIGN